MRPLEPFTPNRISIHAVSPSGRLTPGKVKVLVDFLAEISAAEPKLQRR